MGEAASFVYCFIEVQESGEVKCAPRHLPYLPTLLENLSVVLVGWPRIHYVNQAGLELKDICFLCLPNAGIKGGSNLPQPKGLLGLSLCGSLLLDFSLLETVAL